jgi:hypothetical protein
LKVEADLIEAVNPRANLSRPTPVKDVQRVAVEVLSQFRKIIHEKPPEKASQLHCLVDRRLQSREVAIQAYPKPITMHV